MQNTLFKKLNFFINILIVLTKFSLGVQADNKKIKRKYLIKIVQLPTFKVSKQEPSYFDSVSTIFNSKIPKTKKKIIRSFLRTDIQRQSNPLNEESLKKSVKKISCISQVETESKEKKNKTIELKILTKDKFPFMVDPLNTSIEYNNVLGTNFDYYIEFVPNGLFGIFKNSWNGIVSRIRSKNIHNTNINASFKYKSLNYDSFTRFNFKRSLIKKVLWIGGAEIKRGKRTRKLKIDNNYLLTNVSHNYDKFNFWIGIPIPLYSKEENYFYRIVPTVSFDHWNFYKVSNKLISFTKLSTESRKSLGVGLGFIRKNTIDIKNMYGRNNNNIVNDGQKIYIIGGMLFQDSINRPYIRCEMSNGYFNENLGYISINLITTFVKGGFIYGNQKLNKQNSYAVKTSLCYISKKIGKDWGYRQGLQIDYLGRYGDADQNIVPLSGLYYFNYFNGIYDNLAHRIRANIESVLFTPIQIYFLTIDFLFFCEGIINNSFKDSKIEKNLIFGSGILLSIFEQIDARLSVGYSPTIPNQINNSNSSKLFFSVSLGLSPINADIDISSPKYKSLN